MTDDQKKLEFRPPTDDFADVARISDEMAQTSIPHQSQKEILEVLTLGIPFSSPDEEKGISPMETAQQIIYNESTRHDGDIGPFTAYVVWYAYILGGWKAVGSTSKPDGRYFEVTYNKDADEFYVDTYIKISNRKLTNTSEEDNS